MLRYAEPRRSITADVPTKPLKRRMIRRSSLFLACGVALRPVSSLFVEASAVLTVLVGDLGFYCVVWIGLCGTSHVSLQKSALEGYVAIPLSSWRVNSRTADSLVDGFHWSGLSMPRHIVPVFGGESLEMLGW
jgi:hypothetical protein